MWWDCLSQNAQCHSLAVGHRKICDETAFSKMCNVTHLLLVIGKDVMRLPLPKFSMSLTCCWAWERMWWDCLSHNVQCHSLPVGHGKQMWWDCLSQCVQCHSLAVGHRKDVMRLPFTKCTISLTFCWSLEMMWWDCHSQNVQCHSHSVGHWKRCDVTAIDKMCNVAHKLLVIGKDVMLLPLPKSAMSLTSCWLEKMWWDYLSQNVQYHSHPVGHRRRHDETAFHQMGNISHLLLVRGKRCDETAFAKMCNVTHLL